MLPTVHPLSIGSSPVVWSGPVGPPGRRTRRPVCTSGSPANDGSARERGSTSSDADTKCPRTLFRGPAPRVFAHFAPLRVWHRPCYRRLSIMNPDHQTIRGSLRSGRKSTRSHRTKTRRDLGATRSDHRSTRSDRKSTRSDRVSTRSDRVSTRSGRMFRDSHHVHTRTEGVRFGGLSVRCHPYAIPVSPNARRVSPDAEKSPLHAFGLEVSAGRLERETIPSSVSAISLEGNVFASSRLPYGCHPYAIPSSVIAIPSSLKVIGVSLHEPRSSPDAERLDGIASGVDPYAIRVTVPAVRVEGIAPTVSLHASASSLSSFASSRTRPIVNRYANKESVPLQPSKHPIVRSFPSSCPGRPSP